MKTAAIVLLTLLPIAAVNAVPYRRSPKKAQERAEPLLVLTVLPLSC
jgi:hypothetical protein